MAAENRKVTQWSTLGGVLLILGILFFGFSSLIGIICGALGVASFVVYGVLKSKATDQTP